MKEEIKNELKDISLLLLKAGNRNPYTVPKGYWFDLESKVNQSLDLINEIDDIPSDYFTNLTDRVLIEAKSEAKILTLNYKKWIAAASVIIICFAGYLTLMEDKLDESAPKEFVLEMELEEAFDYLIDENGIYLSDALSIVDEDIFLEEEPRNIFLEENIENVLEDLDVDQLEELF